MNNNKSNIIGVGLIIAFFILIALVGIFSNKVEEQEEVTKKIDIYLFTTEYGESWLDEIRDGNDEFVNETKLIETYNCNSNDCILASTSKNNVLVFDNNEVIIFNPYNKEIITLDNNKIGDVISKVDEGELQGNYVIESNGIAKGIIFTIGTEESLEHAYYSLVTNKYEIDYTRADIIELELDSIGTYAIVKCDFKTAKIDILTFDGSKYVASPSELAKMNKVEGTNIYYVETHISSSFEVYYFKENGELINDYLIFDAGDSSHIKVKNNVVTIMDSDEGIHKYDINGNAIK